jgi:hypothetical protein
VDQALSQVKALRGLIPMCSWCRKVRDDEGYWSQVEAYIHAHTDAEVSHGLCPSCLEKHFPGLAASIDDEDGD